MLFADERTLFPLHCSFAPGMCNLPLAQPVLSTLSHCSTNAGPVQQRGKVLAAYTGLWLHIVCTEKNNIIKQPKENIASQASQCGL